MPREPLEVFAGAEVEDQLAGAGVTQDSSDFAELDDPAFFEQLGFAVEACDLLLQAGDFLLLGGEQAVQADGLNDSGRGDQT